MSFKLASRSSIFLLIAFLSACGDPLPQEKLGYAGEWRSETMWLQILEDGSVSYQRVKKGITTKVNGPIQEFQGDSFVVGFGPFKTTFVVSKPPHMSNGKMQMVVDGELLTRTSP